MTPGAAAHELGRLAGIKDARVTASREIASLRPTPLVSQMAWCACYSLGSAPSLGLPSTLRHGLLRRCPGVFRGSTASCMRAFFRRNGRRSRPSRKHLHEKLQPHVTIHFGLSQSAKGFRIERSAHNRASPRADAAGALPRDQVILPQGPGRLDSPLPASALIAHLKERSIPAAPSRSAGRYLCNFLYYLSLDWAARQERAPAVLFVHMPPFAVHGGPLSEAELLDGAEAILRFVLAADHQGKPRRSRRRIRAIEE